LSDSEPSTSPHGRKLSRHLTPHERALIIAERQKLKEWLAAEDKDDVFRIVNGKRPLKKHGKAALEVIERLLKLDGATYVDRLRMVEQALPKAAGRQAGSKLKGLQERVSREIEKLVEMMIANPKMNHAQIARALGWPIETERRYRRKYPKQIAKRLDEVKSAAAK
jgi:hypothetical protein